MTDAELIAMLRKEGTADYVYGEGADPDICLQASHRIEALVKERDRAWKVAHAATNLGVKTEAKLASAVAALQWIAEYLPSFDYVSRDDYGIRPDLPGSPYDRGKADAAGMLAKIARDALAEIDAEQNETKP